MLFKLAFSLTFAIFAIIVVTHGQNDYCNICENHTLCRFTNPRAVCNARVSSLSSEQQNEIVNVHNELRRKVASGNEKRGKPGPQPAAKSMPNLVWDSELATVAQRWANQCKFGHDACRSVRRFYVGQNVAMSWTTGSHHPSLTSLVTMWYDEVADFNKNYVDALVFEMATGHYTQFVWAETTRIGCGFVNYQDEDKNTILLVCNYGPGGNIQGAKVYERR